MIWKPLLAIALLAAPADEPELLVIGDGIVDGVVNGVPARIKLDPGAPGSPIFNPDFAARAGFKPSMIGFIARIGPVKVPGATDVVRIDIGRGEFKRRAGWFQVPYVTGADGAIGPGMLDAPVVRYQMRPAQPGERAVSLPMADYGRAGIGTKLQVGGDTIVVRFSLMRDYSIATAGAGAAIAQFQSGAFDKPPEQMLVYLGVIRTVRHMAIRSPLEIGPLSITGLMVRTGDFGTTESIPEADAPEADPDEIVVTGGKKGRRELRVEIGRDYLDNCSSIVFDKPKKTITLSCR
ncbi:hypothetical protein P1X14_19995 [Sphingomonas sp. AOB5]|uniref:hypothetical protein n=1 Tax=Sphingomonas sp. AOB5 TaxID=3034017 RepID=UPI0023F97A0A|nr:hypothetical protein [Sphingomonas sp. AOB5]MDF7777548.1 hypothetical protein [Sphingomonas sp. AOB5]